jgi:hypothetical protein
MFLSKNPSISWVDIYCVVIFKAGRAASEVVPTSSGISYKDRLKTIKSNVIVEQAQTWVRDHFQGWPSSKRRIADALEKSGPYDYTQ